MSLWGIKASCSDKSPVKSETNIRKTTNRRTNKKIQINHPENFSAAFSLFDDLRIGYARRLQRNAYTVRFTTSTYAVLECYLMVIGGGLGTALETTTRTTKTYSRTKQVKDVS